MADKFRTTFTIPVTLAAGEQPTNTKLNSISTQSRNGLALLERAIGDLWNQSGDAASSAYPNRIVNLARAMGDQALITSKIPLPDFTGTTSVRVRQPIANFLGKSEILLDFKPTVDSTLRSSVDALRYTASLTYDASEVTTPTTDSQWAVDTAKGRIKLGAALHTTQPVSYGAPPHTAQPVSYIEYNVAAADFAAATDSLDSSSFSMIPNQSQTDWKGLKICQIAANQYNIVLPFRRPDSAPAGLSKLPLNTNNSAETGSPSTIYYWGPAASGYVQNATISSNKFYRYTLPQVVLGMFTSPVAGTTIPSGSLYLWDTVTNTIVEGVTFKVPSVTPTLVGVASQQPFILQVDGVSLDQVFNGPNGNFTSSMTTDVPADYMSRFAIICVGQSLASAVSLLKKDLTEGDAAVGPRKRPSHRDLTETQPAAGARHSMNVPPSFVDGDDHSHLLSRLGSADTATTSAHRDRFNNGILGDLLLLSSDSASNYQNQSAHSRKLYFGSKASTAPRLGTLVTAQSAGPAYGNITTSLFLENAGLLVSNGLIGGNNLHLLLDGNRNIAVFDDANGLSGVYWGQRILLNATTQVLTNFTGSVNSSRYIDINTASANKVTWKGAVLDLSAVASDTNAVVVGSTNTSTHLRLANNQLHFGASVDNDTLKYNDTHKTFTFRVDGTNDTTNLTAAIVVAGVFRTASNSIQFGGNSTTSSNNTLSYLSNVFTFQAGGVTNNSIAEAGRLRATANEIYFGTGTTEKISFGSNLFSFTGDILAGTITGSIVEGTTFRFANETDATIVYDTSKDHVVNKFNGDSFDGVFQSGTIRTELIKPNHAVADIRKYIRDIVIDLGSATFKSDDHGINNWYSVGSYDHDIAPLTGENYYAVVDLTPYLGYNPRFYQIDFVWNDLYAGTGQITEVWFQDNDGSDLWIPTSVLDFSNKGNADSSSLPEGSGSFATYSKAYLRTNTSNTTQGNTYTYRIASYDGAYFSFYHNNGDDPIYRDLKHSADRQIFLVFQTQEEDGGPAQPMMAGRYLRIVVGYESLNDMLSIMESAAYPSFL
jgi:hypothetical protein